MNARMVGRGFINGFSERKGSVFAAVSVQYGQQYIRYSVLVDPAFVASMRAIGPLDEYAAYFANKPVVVCILNPLANAPQGGDGKQTYTGVLAGFCEFSLYKAGMYDTEIFGN